MFLIIRLCPDINECDESNGPNGRCGENAVCSNSPGTFSCMCEPGFSGNPFQQCKGKHFSFCLKFGLIKTLFPLNGFSVHIFFSIFHIFFH